MCYWGCAENNMMYKCKYCGTRYCKACKRGAFYGEMIADNTCRICNQPRCQGEKIRIETSIKKENATKNSKNKNPKSASSKKGLKKKTK